MIRLSKKTEYALLAISHLRDRDGAVASVADIANHFHIPPAILAKVMQGLSRQGMVRSVKGMRGGYVLAIDPATVNLLDFFGICGEDTDLVECLREATPSCGQLRCCGIRDPITSLNAILQEQLRMLTLATLFDLSPPVLSQSVPLRDTGTSSL